MIVKMIVKMMECRGDHHFPLENKKMLINADKMLVKIMGKLDSIETPMRNASKHAGKMLGTASKNARRNVGKMLVKLWNCLSFIENKGSFW